jgi:hypothetical protein
VAAKKWKIAKLYGMQETTFRTDPDATGAAYKFLKSMTDATWQPSADVVERPAMTGDLTRQPHVMGAKSGKLAFKLEMKGSGTAAGSAVAAIASESSPFLEACLGTVTRGTGVLTGVGSTTTSIVVTSSSNFSVGMLVSINGEARFVTAIPDGTHLTVDHALSGAPLTGVTVYASSRFTRANTGHKSMAFVAIRDGIEYTLLGCKGTVKLEGTTAKGTAVLHFELDVATWTATAKGSLPSTALAGVTAVKAPIVKGSPFALSGTTRLISGLDFDPGQSFVWQETTEDADAKSGFELVDAQPKGSFKSYYNSDQLSDFVAGNAKSIALTVGDQPTGWGIYVPALQYMSTALEDANGLVMESLPFSVNDNGGAPEYYICQF